MAKLKSVRRLDIFGRRFELQLKGKERTGTYVGFFATILFVVFIMGLTVPEIQKLYSHAIDQTSYSTTFYEESMIPNLNTTDTRQYVAFEILDSFED